MAGQASARRPDRNPCYNLSMRLGLVSDTHSLYDPLLDRLFAGVDAILHAGDVGSAEVLESLGRLAPVHAIRGNIDEKKPTRHLPAHLAVELGGWRFLLLHDLGKPAKPNPAAARLITREDPTIVLAGHSHNALLEEAAGRFFVNPGGAGKKRFKLQRTAGILRLDGPRAAAEIFSLEDPALPLWKHRDFFRPAARRGA